VCVQVRVRLPVLRSFLVWCAVQAERLLADIVKVEYVEEDKVFFITYRESAVEEVTLEYEAKTLEDRAAIVYKLEFILSLEDRSRIVSKRAARP
jgi:hypothetical protein